DGSLPARLQHAGDLAGGGQLAHGNARHLELAVDAARPPGQLTAVALTRRRAVARQFGKLQLRLEPLLGRRLAIAGDRLQPRPRRRLLTRQAHAAVVLFDRTLLCHREEIPRRLNFGTACRSLSATTWPRRRSWRW